MSPYMRVLILAGIVPLALSFYPPLKIYRYWRGLCLSLCLILLIFGTWDICATWRGHWSFPAAGVGRVRIVNLPLEEVLFFVIIPFCCIFTWEAFRHLVFSLLRRRHHAGGMRHDR